MPGRADRRLLARLALVVASICTACSASQATPSQSAPAAPASTAAAHHHRRAGHRHHKPTRPRPARPPSHPRRLPELSLITEPAAGMAPIYAAISHARSSIELVMYELEDARIDQLLIDARRRGVRVRVLLNSGYYGEGFAENDAAYAVLRRAGVEVRWTPAWFALTHEKALIVDGRVAYIMTFNLTSRYYSTSRDFAIVDRKPADVAAIAQVFAADYDHQQVAPSDGDDLVWSPGALESQLAIIDGARRSLDVENEEMEDADVISALCQAAGRGVSVRVVMTYESDWAAAFGRLEACGAHVHTYAEDASIYIHAKLIVADNARVFLGSQNFSTTSLDRNRELGIEFTDAPRIIASLDRSFDSDYAGAA